MRRRGWAPFAASLALVLAGPGWARAQGPDAPAGRIEPADTAFLILCTALGLLTLPGLGLFYGGMVRRKNVLATFQQCIIPLGVVGLLWVCAGYSLAFAPGLGGLIGAFDWAGLSGVGLAPAASDRYGPAIPHQLHMAYQLVLAALAPALISGAVVERVKFSAYVLFVTVWSLLVYAPVAHWVWSPDGWAARLGAVDFAGGLVVHATAGAAALAAALAVGRRRGLGEEEMYPHNLTLTAVGTGLLWFGWIGLNAGAALAADRAAVAALVATLLAGAAGSTTWSAIEWWHKGKATVLGACTGAVAGLVAISPAAGFVTPASALWIGGLVCFAVYGAILLKGRFTYDDSLDVVAVHGVGGGFGVLATGFLARADLAGAGNPGGLFDGHADQVGYQGVALAAATGYSFAATFGLLRLLGATIGLRALPEDEEAGLDLAQHGERGYIMGLGELMAGRPAADPGSPGASLRPRDEIVTPRRP